MVTLSIATQYTAVRSLAIFGFILLPKSIRRKRHND